MKKLIALTTALGLTAIGGWVMLGPTNGESQVSIDISTVEALKLGDMRKLRFHPAPVAASDVAFLAEDGADATLEMYKGKIIVLNFWATWCAPCRKEMPHLRDLQAELGDEHFQVVTIATGRNDPMGMKEFLDSVNVTNLPLHRDPTSALARDMGVLGLPITVILDRSGMEIARLQGDADWASESAKNIVRALLEM